MDTNVLLELANNVETDREEVIAVIGGKDNVNLPEEVVKEPEELKAKGNADLFNLIGKMRIPEKIKLALFGNQMARMILIRDTSSKQIPFFVLHNARITESEIHELAKNTNLDDTVLRAIAANSHFMKSYAVKVAIVSNPKVPIDVSLKWVKFLMEKDLKRLSGSRNIPQVLATHCRKLIDDKKK